MAELEPGTGSCLGWILLTLFWFALVLGTTYLGGLVTVVIAGFMVYVGMVVLVEQKKRKQRRRI